MAPFGFVQISKYNTIKILYTKTPKYCENPKKYDFLEIKNELGKFIYILYI